MAQPPQEQSSADFFISYTGIDRSWATWIAWQIEEAGYTTRIQAWDFRPGSNFVHDMQTAAADAERTVAVLSPDYLTSGFAQAEWYAAFAQDPLGDQGLLLPVQVRACNPRGLLPQIVYVDLVGLSEDEAKTALLAGIERTRAKPLTPPAFPAAEMTAEAVQRTPPRFPGALPPIWNVPHDRNPNFTGRTELLSELHDSLHAGHATVLRQALRGLGGVGKTQLALEYAYRHTADYSVVWWVPSETSPATVYAELTRELGLPQAEASESEVRVQAVKRWLEQHAGWLLVFDNATEPEAVKPYLPQGQGGHVIITSRYWDWGDVASGLGVEVFDQETESVPFLLWRSGQADEAAARVLADALGNLPLALAQAAAYIASTGTTLAEYTELFETRRAELWAEEAAPGDYPVPVGATWSLAMDEVKKESGAAELLYLLAYFAPEPVSRDWLVEGAEHLPEPLDSLVQDRLAWNRIGRAFRRYGLVEVTDAGLLVHRLVQAVTRDRLAESEQQAWASVAVQAVGTAYPEETFRPQDVLIWSKCAVLLSHALVTTQHAEALAVRLEETGGLLSRIKSYWHAQGRYEEAVPLSERALRIIEQALGVEHPDVATFLSNLANLYRVQGRYDEAEPLYLRVVKMDEVHLGTSVPEVAISLNGLAEVYQAQGRYDKAEPLYQKALQISEDIFGNSHPDIAICLNNLANLYQNQGRYEEAEPLYQKVLQINEQFYGSAYPDVAINLNGLATLYANQGRYEEAEPLYQRALQIGEEVLGASHPSVATLLNNLATLYRDQCRYDEVEPLYQRALAIAEAALGPEHPRTLRIRTNCAQLRQQRAAASLAPQPAARLASTAASRPAAKA